MHRDIADGAASRLRPRPTPFDVRLAPAVAMALAVLLAAAVCSDTGIARLATEESAAPTAATPAPDAEPRPDPLLTISGSVVDDEGNTLAVTISVGSSDPLTDSDKADLTAARCTTGYPSDSDMEDPDARIVTATVTAVGVRGFSGWSDARGAEVQGSLFDGVVWKQAVHSHSAPCDAPSLLGRPGTGTVRSFVSPLGWHLVGPIPEGSAVTLGQYGFGGQRPNVYDEPAAVTSVTGCAVSASPEIESLAARVATEAVWGENRSFPEYCIYGRNGQE
jgi:hypothetical protein